jgi:hypothetical protein
VAQALSEGERVALAVAQKVTEWLALAVPLRAALPLPL